MYCKFLYIVHNFLNICIETYSNIDFYFEGQNRVLPIKKRYMYFDAKKNATYMHLPFPFKYNKHNPSNSATQREIRLTIACRILAINVIHF